MKKILLPTDFSDNARHTMEYVIKLYGSEPAHFELIHAYDLPHSSSTVTSKRLLNTIKQDSENDMKKEVEHLSVIMEGTGHQFSSTLERGSISNVLTSGDRRNADLIAIGSQGKGATPEYRFGSNTLKVMQHADIPVLVIPKDLDYNPIKKIVYGADLGGLSDNSVLDPVVELLEKYDAIIEIAHISEFPNSEKKRRMDDLIRFFGVDRARSKYLDQVKISEGLEKLVEKTNPDLLVMVNRQKSFFTRIFYPSITRKLILHTSIPILVLHDK